MWESKYTRVLVREQNKKCERETIQQEATQRSDERVSILENLGQLTIIIYSIYSVA